MVGVNSFAKCFNGHEIIKCVQHKDKTNIAVRKVHKTKATNLQRDNGKLISRHVLLPLYAGVIMLCLYCYICQ